MKIDKIDTGNLTADLTIVIEKDDFIPDYKKKLKSLQAKSQLKGFRKGKAPSSIIEKMYGGQAMQEIISKLLTDQINGVITGEDYDIIGEPIFKDENNVPEIDHKNPQDYTYNFKIGLEPEFDVTGLEESNVYTKYDIQISDTLLEEEKENIKKRMGTQDSTDQVITDGDIIYMDVQEKENGAVKEDGVEANFSVQFDSLTEEYKKTFKTKKKDDELEIDVYALEENLPKESVHKYLLKINPDGDINPDDINPKFHAVISNVVRLKPAEFNQELFDKYFGKDNVKDETAAEEKIREYMGEYYNQESDNMLNREIMEALMEKNSFDLPEDFLKDWIDKESKMPDDQFQGFLKELKWSLIKKKLVKRFEVKVEEKEIFDYFVKAVRNYSPYIDENSLKNTVFSLMQNREQLNKAVETISSGKLFDEVRKVVKTESKSIEKDDFYDKVKTIQEKK